MKRLARSCETCVHWDRSDTFRSWEDWQSHSRQQPWTHEVRAGREGWRRCLVVPQAQDDDQGAAQAMVYEIVDWFAPSALLYTSKSFGCAHWQAGTPEEKR